MTLKTPSFWYRDLQSAPSLRERALAPAAQIYKFFYAMDHKAKKPAKARVPVICIGNITAGGTGKTPTAIAICESLKSSGVYKNPYFLIRGYGGAETGPLKVDLDAHTAWDVGDEALILAQHAPTIIGGDRAASAAWAADNGADCVIMDDGLQNPGIHKDIALVAVNGEMGFGNQKMMPAGPLRQPLKDGFDMADGFIFIGEDHRDTISILPKDKPVFKAQLAPSKDFKPDTKTPYIAFAGLGYPQKFFNFLKNTMQMNIVDTIAFSDHHPYEIEDIQDLQNKASNAQAKLITTEKDMMRIPVPESGEYETPIEAVPVQMVWDDEAALLSLVKNKLSA